MGRLGPFLDGPRGVGVGVGVGVVVVVAVVAVAVAVVVFWRSGFSIGNTPMFLNIIGCY